MSVTVSLYNNTGDKLETSSTFLTSLEVCSGSYRGEVNLINPQITLEASEESMASCNYFSVFNGSLVRYYWVTEKTALRTGLWQISGSADVRRTFLDGIKASYGIVARNEHFYNMYLEDAKIPVMAKPTMNVYKFGNTPFNRSTHEILLITAGGK